MSDPFIFVATLTINEGQRARIEDLARAFAEHVEVADTGLVAYHFHLSDDGTEVSNVQVHVDAASMEAYLPHVTELITQAVALATTSRIDVFGTPGPLAQRALEANAELGARVRVMPNHVAGFTRAAA